ncbi:MAG: hypothetical protein FWG36_01185, partial [Oscillospiraceae bacterium]|nr:hypothetical protein [Oscillospiraceae bacterium]
DYNFYMKDAIDENIAYVVSMDRLLLMRVFAMENQKYMDDLNVPRRANVSENRPLATDRFL